MTTPPRPWSLPFTREVLHAVWTAEDGRCERCGRAMDQRVASALRIDPTRNVWTAANLYLVCPDCLWGHPDLLTHSTVALSMHQQLEAVHGPEHATALGQVVLKALRRYGVLVRRSQGQRQYWLPGIGRFQVAEVPAGAPATIELLTLYEAGHRPPRRQARTRGLPKPAQWPVLPPRPLRSPAHTATGHAPPSDEGAPSGTEM